MQPASLIPLSMINSENAAGILNNEVQLPVRFAQRSILVLITLGRVPLRNSKSLQALHYSVINCHYHLWDKGLHPGEMLSGAAAASRLLYAQQDALQKQQFNNQWEKL